jgi:FdhD protein
MKVQHAAVLAGGQSSRMGREKALLPWRGRPLVAHVAGILRPLFPHLCVVTAKAEVAAAAQLTSVADLYEKRGPLGGIHAALSHYGAPTFVVACDMPFVNCDLVRYLAENFVGDAIVPLSEEGGFEPLCAIYAPSCLPIFTAALTAEGKMPALRRLLSDLDTRFVPVEVVRRFDPTLHSFSNWNSPEDLPNGDEWHGT